MALDKVLVVDDTKLITRIIHDKLAASGYEVLEVHDGAAALGQLETFNPDLVILDVMLPGMDGYQVARAIRQNSVHARTPIIMLTARVGMADKIAGFEAGADDYVTKPFDPTELELRVRALIGRTRVAHRREAPSSLGKVITVFSLRGGAGVTSVAVNLAVALAQLFDQEVPLVDLALETSGASIMLDLLPRLTLSHLAKSEAPLLEAHLVKDYLTPHSSRVRLLAAPTMPVLAELVTAKLVQQTLAGLRANFAHVILDTSHNLSEVSLAALDAADAVLMLVPPDIVSLKAATGTLETFASLGYPESRTTFAINWVFPRRGLPQKEIEAALGRPALAVIPYEGEALVRSINEGVPLMISQPNLAWSLAVEGLAFQLATEEARSGVRESVSPRLAALQKRLAN